MPDEKKTREQLVDAAIAKMNKKFGARTVEPLSRKQLDPDVIPTGSLALDYAIGIGGIPKKRTTEIYGPPSGGKTSLAQHIAAECQAQGGLAVYIDMERKVAPRYAAACGVDMDRLIFSRPPEGVAALEIAVEMIPLADVVIIDSAYYLVTPGEVDSEVGAANFARLARLLSQTIKAKVSPALATSNCAMVFINQVRTGIGQGGRGYETTPGGYALKFEDSLKIRLRQAKILPHNIGVTIHAVVKKNNLDNPLRECNFDLIFGRGINKVADVLELAKQTGVITVGGGWYKYRGEYIAESKGKLPVIAHLTEHPELLKEIRETALCTEH